MISLLRSRNFRVKPERLPPTGVGKATLLIDLQPDLDTILAGMSMTKRQNIRRGLRKGVKVRIGDGADAETVRRLMWRSCQRRGLSPAPPQKDFFENLWRALGPAGGVKFFIAEVNSEPTSVACVMLSGSTMHLWRVGWSGRYDEYDPNDVLHWETIKWAKEHGCREFDFMHIRPDHAKAIVQGTKIKDSYSGVTDFKMGFGGQLRLLPELYYRSYNPIIHSALGLGAEQLIDSSRGIRLLRSVSQKVRNFRTS
jgi:lipid II:glycine glycyltransferase (peptidoglycan interpeptide bridge formation enzyme)